MKTDIYNWLLILETEDDLIKKAIAYLENHGISKNALIIDIPLVNFIELSGIVGIDSDEWLTSILNTI